MKDIRRIFFQIKSWEKAVYRIKTPLGEISSFLEETKGGWFSRNILPLLLDGFFLGNPTPVEVMVKAANRIVGFYAIYININEIRFSSDRSSRTGSRNVTYF